jgi:hypothetical protein
MHIATLKARAKKSASERGHVLGHFMHWPSLSHINKDTKVRALAVCQTCSADVLIITHPLPNEIDMAGPALATVCRRRL